MMEEGLLRMSFFVYLQNTPVKRKYQCKDISVLSDVTNLERLDL